MHMYFLAYVVCMSACAWYVIIDDGKGYEISLEHKCLGLSGSWGITSYQYFSSSFRIKIPFVCKLMMILHESRFNRYLNIDTISKVNFIPSFDLY